MNASHRVKNWQKLRKWLGARFRDDKHHELQDAGCKVGNYATSIPETID
jgi:hypothetical protein